VPGTTDRAALIAEARQYRQQGDINAAVIQLKNALQKAPVNRDARRLLGEVCIAQQPVGLWVQKKLYWRVARNLGGISAFKCPEWRSGSVPPLQHKLIVSSYLGHTSMEKLGWPRRSGSVPPLQHKLIVSSYLGHTSMEKLGWP
jgi:hypothetical protein